MSPGRCAALLLTWNGAADAPYAARSLLAQTEPDLDIRWIDNASTDDTMSRVRAEVPEFPLPELMEKNVGFCAGHNRAFAATDAPYYLALNQDVVLAPDYIERLCDWMDEDESLASTSGLVLSHSGDWEDPPLDPDSTINSAGMAMGLGRFPFELRMGREPTERDRERQFVPAVTGAAMMIRRSAMEKVADRPGELFPPEFFAYFEEVDLALRIARAGLRCGVEGSALAWHAARGRGGKMNPAIRKHYIKNHWLVTFRNDRWTEMLAELPYIAKGELVHYVPQYLKALVPFIKARFQTLTMLPEARRVFRRGARKFPDSTEGRRRFYKESRRLLKEGR